MSACSECPTCGAITCLACTKKIMDAASSPFELVECVHCHKRETVRWLCDNHLLFVQNFTSATIRGAIKFTMQDMGLGRANVYISAKPYGTDIEMRNLTGQCRLLDGSLALAIFGREDSLFFEALAAEEVGDQIGVGVHLASIRVCDVKSSAARVLMRDKSPARVVHVRDAFVIAAAMRRLVQRDGGE